MEIVKTIGNFILSAWIWNMTFDWFHPMMTGFVMFLCIWLIFRRSIFHALWMSICAQLVVIGVLSGAVMLLSHMLNWQYEPLVAKVAITQFNTLSASISLACVYTVVQLFYFAFGALFWRYNIRAFLVMTVLSNALGFALSYMFIQMVRAWYYVG